MANDNDNIEEHSILLAVMQETLVNYLCWSVMSGVDTCYCCVSDDTELGCEQRLHCWSQIHGRRMSGWAQLCPALVTILVSPHHSLLQYHICDNITPAEHVKQGKKLKYCNILHHIITYFLLESLAECLHKIRSNSKCKIIKIQNHTH